MRELRLVFGSSTAANAAVLAIFMGGLGVGGALLGRRADKHPNPLRMYGLLEVGITATAFFTPFLLLGVRHLYILLGGVQTLGLVGASGVRLFLSAVVLALPTILMGGTLPAAARAVESARDVGRGRLAFLYGANTLGAVAGAAAVTFFLLERLGTRETLWFACLLNGFVAFVALALASGRRESIAADDGEASIPQAPEKDDAHRITVSPRFVFVAAGSVGFVFFLMELVWYRMLASILGGSTFTFGLILAVALFGIGVGGLLYTLVGTRVQATVIGFAYTLALEGLCVAGPYALGDWVAAWAALLRSWGAMGFSGMVLGWTLITCVVVLPTSIVAGFQFPLLISVLGRGQDNVGRHTGMVYAWNTFGAVAGSLAGGFGLLPLVSAPGAWRASVYLLAILAVVTLVVTRRRGGKMRSLPGPLIIVAASLLAVILFQGPSGFWRHSGIGVGWVDISEDSANELKGRMHDARHNIRAEFEGVESSVAIANDSSLAFIVNGKIDGNSRGDATTQVMMGMVSATLHPHPTSALVIGLGTGSSAGWLAAIDSMERVDVAELEPAVLEMALLCGPVNRDALENAKVHVKIGDGRETVLTGKEEYDLIVSAPSNPYRAGIASMYTKEFYSAVAARLAEGGMFSQWVQAYDVDDGTIQTVYATLSSVFDEVTTWQTNSVDLLLVCSKGLGAIEVDRLRERIGREPYKSALLKTWRVVDVEGFLSRYVANADFAAAVSDAYTGPINTDNRMMLEYGFARTLDTTGLFSIAELWTAARARGENRPAVGEGEVDWNLVDYRRSELYTLDGALGPLGHLEGVYRKRALAQSHYVNGSFAALLTTWDGKEPRAETPIELLMISRAYADSASQSALPYIEALQSFMPVDAIALRGHLQWRRGKWAAAAASLIEAFEGARQNPWFDDSVMVRSLEIASHIATNEAPLREKLLRALAEPFSVDAVNKQRLLGALEIALEVDAEEALPYFLYFEPDVPWDKHFLELRYEAYLATGHAFAGRALKDLVEFVGNETESFDWSLSVQDSSEVK